MTAGVEEIQSLPTRSRRYSYHRAAPEVFEAMLGIERTLERSDLDRGLLNLVYLRTSQLNGCAFCIDLHWGDLRAGGVPEQTLWQLSTWRDSSAFTGRQRAALAWTEAVTRLTGGTVPDEVFEIARQEFDERTLATLTLAIAAINGWNRLNMAFRTPPKESVNVDHAI